MTSQNLNQNKNPYLDKLLDWYDKSKLQDQNDIKLHKENFIKSLKDINKEEIKKLNDELESYIKNQDFENAIIIRDKIKSLK